VLLSSDLPSVKTYCFGPRGNLQTSVFGWGKTDESAYFAEQQAQQVTNRYTKQQKIVFACSTSNALCHQNQFLIKIVSNKNLDHQVYSFFFPHLSLDISIVT